MQIERNTSEQLVVQDIPWAVGIVLCAGIITLMGWALFELSHDDVMTALMLIVVSMGCGVIFCFAVRRIDVLCDRPQNLLEIRQSTVFRRTRVQHKLENLARAEVESMSDPRHPRKKFHRIALILDGGMDEGTHPLTDGYEHGRRAERAAKAIAHTINDWLAQDVDSDALST